MSNRQCLAVPTRCTYDLFKHWIVMDWAIDWERCFFLSRHIITDTESRSYSGAHKSTPAMASTFSLQPYFFSPVPKLLKVTCYDHRCRRSRSLTVTFDSSDFAQTSEDHALRETSTSAPRRLGEVKTVNGAQTVVFGCDRLGWNCRGDDIGCLIQ